MKKIAPLLSLVFAVLLVFSVSIAVSAASDSKKAGENPAISKTDTVVLPSVDSGSSGSDLSVEQGESLFGSEASDGAESEAEQVEASPTPQKSNNTPFFIGAGIAVLMFIGVSLYCKKNGNKTF